MSMLLLLGIPPKLIFPQQRKLMGSSAQISSGVRRCGSQDQVPEEGSGRFRKVPEGSGVKWCRFRRRVPESSGGKWFRRQVPEDFGRFRRMLAQVQEVSSGRFRKVGSGRSRKVLEGSGELRRVLV